MYGMGTGCDSLLGLHCSSRVGLGLLCFGGTFPATVPLLLWCWVHLSPTFASSAQIPLVVKSEFERVFFQNTSCLSWDKLEGCEEGSDAWALEIKGATFPVAFSMPFLPFQVAFLSHLSHHFAISVGPET